MFNFELFKVVLILTELGKFAKFGSSAWVSKNSNDAQYKHEWTERAVRVNGQINEVMQLLAWAICLICQLSMNYGKTQMSLA